MPSRRYWVRSTVTDQTRNTLRSKQGNTRSQLLTEADQLVNGDRNNQYGDPNGDFESIARMWNAYLARMTNNAPIMLEPWDVAAMMALLKISRIAWSADKKDHWVDLAGYAACGWDCVHDEV